VISMEEQVFSLGELVGGPLIGVIGSTISLKLALFITGLVRVPVAVLFGRLVLLGKKSEIDKSKDMPEP
jgi:DHA3 family tetracycline resistance protein-like MFS transporter